MTQLAISHSHPEGLCQFAKRRLTHHALSLKLRCTAMLQHQQARPHSMHFELFRIEPGTLLEVWLGA